VTDFEVPDGVVSAQIDADSGQLATSACPRVVTDYYILGTQPTQFCLLHAGGSTEIASWETSQPATPASLPTALPSQAMAQPTPGAPPNPNNNPQQKPKKKSGFFDKLKSIFR
jgi:penicillin-binding protein 1B